MNKRLIPVVLMLTLVWPSAEPVLAAAFDDVATGNWSAPATWNPNSGYPDGTDDNATLNSHAVVLDVSPTIGSLTINATAGSLDTSGQRLILTGGFTFSRGYTFGNGTIVVTNSSLTITTQDYGPTNATTLELYGGGVYNSTAGGRILANNGTINLRGGRFTQSGRNITGTGTMNIFPGTAYTNYAVSTYNANANFINNNGILHSTPDTLSIGGGTHSGRFTGRGFTFSGTHTFQNGSAIELEAGGIVAVDAATWEAGASLITSNLTIRNNGKLTMYAPFSVESFNGGAPSLVTSSVPLMCSGAFTWQSGLLLGDGSITAGQFVVSMPGGGSVSTNVKPITVLNGGTFNSGASDSIFWNLGRIEFQGGVFSLISSKNHVFRGGGTVYIGPSATIHRNSQSSTLLQENATTNAGTVKVTFGAINFSGGFTQLPGGRTIASGGTVQIGASNTFLGGSLEGSSTINCASLANNGALTVKPGVDSTAKLTLSQATVLDGDDTVAIELGGTSQGTNYDWLACSSTLDLGGCELDVSFVNGFEDAIQGGAVFTNITGNLSGTLGNLSLGRIMTSDSKGSFAVTITTGSGGRVVLSDFQPSAGPGTVMLIR
jgi:hypothetical protein